MSLVLLEIPALVLLYLVTIYLSTSQLSRKVDGEQEGSGLARLKIFFTLLKNDVTLRGTYRSLYTLVRHQVRL